MKNILDHYQVSKKQFYWYSNLFLEVLAFSSQINSTASTRYRGKIAVLNASQIVHLIKKFQELNNFFIKNKDIEDLEKDEKDEKEERDDKFTNLYEMIENWKQIQCDFSFLFFFFFFDIFFPNHSLKILK